MNHGRIAESDSCCGSSSSRGLLQDACCQHFDEVKNSFDGSTSILLVDRLVAFFCLESGKLQVHHPSLIRSSWTLCSSFGSTECVLMACLGQGIHFPVLCNFPVTCRLRYLVCSCASHCLLCSWSGSGHPGGQLEQFLLSSPFQAGSFCAPGIVHKSSFCEIVEVSCHKASSLLHVCGLKGPIQIQA